ncbi:MAG: hypothetical protein NTW03_04960 [Verrucomicrobia bacterium]|nr:hypothetical protein [Verrucomicrobiota bacterium]
MNPLASELSKLTPAALEGLRALCSIIEAGLATAPPPPAAPRRTVQEVGNELLISKARTGRCVDYMEVLRVTLHRLFRGRMLREVHTITTAELELWASSKEFSARYRRTMIMDARNFFGFAQRRGYVTSNPALALEIPRAQNKPVEIQTPAQVAALLHTAERSDPDIMRVLAVCYFAGLRTSAATQLAENEITGQYLEVKAEKCKTRRRRLVIIQPALRAWLSAGGKLPVTDVDKRLATVKRASGVPCPRNAARHSFCSYHLAAFGSSAKTAMEAGHSETILFSNYRELVTPEVAAEYWAIRPKLHTGQGNILAVPFEKAA